MSQSKTVFVVALSFLLCVGLNLGASDDEDSGGKGGLHGVQEFFTSGTFTVPKHVTHIMLTMWGAGGGGGAAALPPPACVAGASGGGGAYTNTVVRVIPGQTYNVVVGMGGAGGQNQGGNGGDGGDSQFALGNTILAFAGGGKGGGAAPPFGNGIAGAGGQADATAQISHSPTFTQFGSNGPYVTPSYLPYAYNLAPNLQVIGLASQSYLGSGGLGGFNYNGACGYGFDGTPGYVLLTF